MSAQGNGVQSLKIQNLVFIDQVSSNDRKLVTFPMGEHNWFVGFGGQCIQIVIGNPPYSD